jgi:H+/gluconate symporter-like permease
VNVSTATGAAVIFTNPVVPLAGQLADDSLKMSYVELALTSAGAVHVSTTECPPVAGTIGPVGTTGRFEVNAATGAFVSTTVAFNCAWADTAKPNSKTKSKKSRRIKSS